MNRTASIVVKVETAACGWLDRYSLPLLRVSMGAIILGFGFLKYFPGWSPAQHLILEVNRKLTLGLIPDSVTMALLASVECLIGLSLITSWGLRVVIYPLVLWAVAILSPLVLMSGELFGGPEHTPTLEGQYVLKDIILFASTLVIANATVKTSAYRLAHTGAA